MGVIGNYLDPVDPLSKQNLPVNRFQAQAAQTGTGPTSLNELDYTNLINQAIAQQAGVTGNQNGLVASLQAQANGTGGPNLAQQQLQNATNQNIQSQAGATASLRGLNPALQQRLIAQQGATIQQQAAGQSAEVRMQQQLAAQQQLGNVLAQQAGQNQNQLVTGAGALGNQNALNLQNQQGAQSINAQTAGQNAGLQSAANAQALGLTGYGAQTVGGLAAAGGAIGAAGLGGTAAPAAAAAAPAATSVLGDFVEGAATLAAHGTVVPGKRRFPGNDTRNDTKPYLLSPGEVVVPADVADDPEATAAFVAAMKAHKKKHGKG